MVASLPASVTKFEQKGVINIETSEMTSLVMFHPFHDILAVSDGKGVGIWSLATGTRIMQLPNTSPCTRHTLLSAARGGGGGGRWPTHANNTTQPLHAPTPPAPIPIHPSTLRQPQSSSHGATTPLSSSHPHDHHNYHPLGREGQATTTTTAATMFVRGSAVEQIARQHSQSRHPSIGATPL